jgi:hypothetical protein
MRSAGPDLLVLAARLTRILGSRRCVLVGGLAVSGHGYVRATDDIDFMVDAPMAELRKRLQAEGIAARMEAGDPVGGDFPCLRGAIEGVRFDVMPPLVPLDWEKALDVPTEEGPLRLVDLDGLLRLKLRAQGVQDLLDVAVLVLRQPAHRERAREIATANHVLERLDAILADRRTQASAREQAAREDVATPARAKRRPKRRTR